MRRLMTVAMAALAAAAAPVGAAESLEELESLLRQPVYAASKFAQASADAPVAMTVLTAGDILTFGWRTLAEVLNGARGVLLREDRSYSYIGVRGFGRPGDLSQRVLITIDGMRVNDAVYDQALPGREFPLEVGLIDRVEFIPGPGSSFYGPNAMVAVINVVTKSAAHLGGGNATLGVGSQNSRSLSLRQGLVVGPGSLVLGAHREERPGGSLYFAEFDDGTGARGVVRGGDGETDRKLFAKWRQGGWQAMALWSDRTKDVPTAHYGVDFGAPAPISDRYAAADVQWRASGDTHDAFARLSYVDYAFRGVYPYGADAQVDNARARWVVAEGSWVFRGWPGHRVVIGGEVQRNLAQQQTGRIEGANPQALFDIRGRGQRFGTFVNDEWTLAPTWRVVLGARWDRHADAATSVTPRMALFWQPTEALSVKWVDGRAYRGATVYEALYDDGASQIANPALGVERVRAREIVIDWRASNALRLTGSLFHNRFHDLIDAGVDPGTGLTQYQNTPGVRTRGLEAEADFVAPNGVRVRGSWTGQRTHDFGLAAPLSNAPRSLTKLHASLPLPWQGAVLGVEWLRVGQRRTEQGATMEAHTVLGLTARIAPAGSPWSVTAGVSNALDTAYADPAGPEHAQDALARDGRRWQLQLSLAY